MITTTKTLSFNQKLTNSNLKPETLAQPVSWSMIRIV